MTALFGPRNLIVAMIHLPPLPGAPNFGPLAASEAVGHAIAAAVEDARRLEDGGVDAILLQNSNDHPPRRTVPQSTVAAYTRIAAAVRDAVGIPLGINVLKSDPEATLGIAAAVDAAFVRLKGYVGVEVGAEGSVSGCAADAIRLRRELGGDGRIEIWADAVQPTSRPLGGMPPDELVEWCVAFGHADRVIITGHDLDESLAIIAASRSRTNAPLILGGGVEPATAARAIGGSDGVIVGRYLRGRSLVDPIDPARVREFMSAVPGRSPA